MRVEATGAAVLTLLAQSGTVSEATQAALERHVPNPFTFDGVEIPTEVNLIGIDASGWEIAS